MTETKNFIKVVTCNVEDMMMLDWVDEINPYKCIFVATSAVLENTISCNLEDDVYVFPAAIPASTAMHHLSMKNESGFSSVYNSQLDSHINAATLAVVIKKAIVQEKDIMFVSGSGIEATMDFFKYFLQYLDMKFDIAEDESTSLRGMLGVEDWQKERARKGKRIKPYYGIPRDRWDTVMEVVDQTISVCGRLQPNLEQAVWSTLNSHRIKEIDREMEKKKKKEAKKRKKQLKFMSPQEVYGWSEKRF